MKGVLYALAPAAVFGIYNFGWRALVLFTVSIVLAVATEAVFVFREKKPVTSAVLVTAVLYAMILPPSTPFWIAAVGIVFAVVFGKMVFGGFGQNVFNPAMVGRCFIYISFPVAMTSRWNAAVDYVPRGLDDWLVDAVTTATPIVAGEGGNPVKLTDAFFGFTGGCIGETGFILILLGGIYIIWKKYANWRIPVSITIFALLAQSALFFTGVSQTNPLYMIMTGGFALGSLFMATDPVSAASTDPGRWIFGAIIGIVTVMIRTFGNFAEGFMFALLLGNMFAPIIDYHIREHKKKITQAEKASAQPAGSES